MTFEKFPKIARLMRDITITEKIDGTHAQVHITDMGYDCDNNLATVTRDSVMYNVRAGSRSRWITPADDNFGFARWVTDHAEELVDGLGNGRHYGEWWGTGIQRGYGLDEKRFSLFNTGRWASRFTPVSLRETQDWCPECCHVVPVLYEGPFTTDDIDNTAEKLQRKGSSAAPGFMSPEGVMVWHPGGRWTMKWTFGGDGHKG